MDNPLLKYILLYKNYNNQPDKDIKLISYYFNKILKNLPDKIFNKNLILLIIPVLNFILYFISWALRLIQIKLTKK